MVRVVVVGAGIAGLACVEHLTSDPVVAEQLEVTLLEGRDRIGGRILTHQLGPPDGPTHPCNMGANFVHGCDPDGGNVLFNTSEEHKLCGLVEFEMADEVYYDNKGQVIPVEVVDKIKTVYSDVDTEMLKQAIQLRANESDDVPWGATFKSELARRLAGKKLSKRDRQVLGFLQTNQHAYCAEPAQLSTKDLADAFDAGSLEGGERLTSGGFDGIVRHLHTRLQARPAVAKRLRLGAKVEAIAHDEGGDCGVRLAGGDIIPCDNVVCTLPIGVLRAGTVAFEPPLDAAKQAAVRGLRMGLENRIAVQFTKCFWPADKRYFRCTRFPQFKVLNLHSFGGHDNTLLFFVPPPYSWQIEDQTDAQVLAEVQDCVRTMFGAVETPRAEIVASQVSRWGSDEFSRGSYSYIPHGGSLQMARDLQAKTESGLYFAGEATSATDMQMAHGAMETGIAAAKELLADLFDTGQLLNTYKQLRQYRMANPARQRIPTSELAWFVKHGDKADFCQAWVARDFQNCLAESLSAERPHRLSHGRMSHLAPRPKPPRAGATAPSSARPAKKMRHTAPPDAAFSATALPDDEKLASHLFHYLRGTSGVSPIHPCMTPPLRGTSKHHKHVAANTNPKQVTDQKRKAVLSALNQNGKARRSSKVPTLSTLIAAFKKEKVSVPQAVAAPKKLGRRYSGAYWNCYARMYVSNA